MQIKTPKRKHLCNMLVDDDSYNCDFRFTETTR